MIFDSARELTRTGASETVSERPKLMVARCHSEAVRETIERFHYLRRWPDPRSLPFAYHLVKDGRDVAPDGRPWGVIVMKCLQHKRQSGVFGYPGLPTQWQVLDLARVWVHPSLQTATWMGFDRSGRLRTMSENVFSRMVALTLRRVQRDWIDHHPPPYPELPYHVELILSYCDRAHHQGTGYRAAGFEMIGQTTDGTKDVYARRLKRPQWSYVPLQRTLVDVQGGLL